MTNSPVRAFLRSLFRRKLVLVATLVLGIAFALALFAPWISPFDPGAMRVVRRLRPPNEINWFGTDELGRDIFSRIIWGARASLGIGFTVVLISVGTGATLGLVAGYFKRLDGAIMRLVDALMALPDILLAIFLVAVLGASAGNVILALSIVYTPRVVRVIRASTLVVRELPFVEAAIACGARTPRILLLHIAPSTIAPLIVQATYICASAILVEASLSFLGAGVPPEVPSWGNMIASSRLYLARAPWTIFCPAIALALVVLAVNLLGDGLRDRLDPRLSRRL